MRDIDPEDAGHLWALAEAQKAVEDGADRIYSMRSIGLVAVNGGLGFSFGLVMELTKNSPVPVAGPGEMPITVMVISALALAGSAVACGYQLARRRIAN